MDVGLHAITTGFFFVGFLIGAAIGVAGTACLLLTDDEESRRVNFFKNKRGVGNRPS